MDNYEYRVQLGRQKFRNEREVEALLKAVDAKGSPVRSLMLNVGSSNGLDAQRKFLKSPHLSSLESLALNLAFCLGAESLRILAEVIEDGKISSLQRLSISYKDDDEPLLQLAVSSHHFSTKTSQSRRSSSYSSFTSSRSENLGLYESSLSSSSSSTSRSQTSIFEDGNLKKADPVSWEGFALLGGVLKKNLLPRLEKTVSFNSNWDSRNLGDVGAKYLAELLETGYLSPRLKELNLENNSIGSAGMEALAGALRDGKMFALETLNLNRNIFHGDVTGIMQVVTVMEAGHLPALKWIGLFGAGRQPVTNDGSIADAIVAVFTKNTAVTAVVGIDWPDKILRRRWRAVLERNKNNLAKLRRQEEVPVTNGKIFIYGFPTVGKPTLRSSLKWSRFGCYFRKEN